MKLHIEVELTQEEIPLAEELFKTLRSLTEHVRTRNVGPSFRDLITRLEDTSQLDAVAEELRPLIGNDEAALDEFLKELLGVIFDRELILHEKSVAPYMYILPRLPEHAKAKARDVLISTVLKHLTEKRPVEASRMEFFAQAEAFAVLVNLGFFDVAGAITTIIKLLRRADNRCAAMTMLGKTVEHCLPQLLACDPTALQSLHSVLRSITEDVFQYDINYIEESLGWSRQQEQPTSMSLPDSLPGSSGLRAKESFAGHRSTIFSLAYDARRNQVVSASKDSALLVWSGSGEVEESVDLQRHYACSLDLTSDHTLLVCGVAVEEAVRPPVVLLYTPTARGWKEAGRMVRDSSKLVCCVKGLPQSGGHSFVTGETMAAGTESICLYDMATLSSFSSAQPVREYTEHEELITCLSLFPPNPHIFLSGSRDCSVRVWDRRLDRSVGALGSPVAAAGGRLLAHDQMVTCVDASDSDTVLSAGLDFKVNRWDFRQMGGGGGCGPVASLQMDDSAVLKVALGGGRHTSAVSTLRALYTVDWGGPRPVTRVADPFTDGRRIGRYHDLKWASSRNLLYAGGEDTRVDVYMYS